uniref:Uncharacterized protein n=1 Tax=Podoviridae sp. ct8Lf7 TaxID=2827723 RepID=A0A8S5S1I5_9CAUD|nr:MAG TPA: hypothetical protein [Podoviridae sp. ct8Lf7]
MERFLSFPDPDTTRRVKKFDTSKNYLKMRKMRKMRETICSAL